MKTRILSARSVLTLALFALFCIQAPPAHAQEAIKIRGNIASVDASAKTLQIQHAKRGLVTLTWTDATKVRSPATRNAAELTPGMFILCFLDADEKTILSIRHSPEMDKPVEEKPAE